MDKNDSIKLFEEKQIRTSWNETEEKWYFSIVDVVSVLTDQSDNRHAAKYWSVLKTRLAKEGSELTTNCSQLKMPAQDGKNRLTDVADTEQLVSFSPYLPRLSPGTPERILRSRQGKRSSRRLMPRILG